MSFKTLLRKWHTYIGLILTIPMAVLVGTGIYLLDTPKSNAEHLIASTVCPDGQVLVATNQGLSLNNNNVPVRFPLTTIAALACTDTSIHVVHHYGNWYHTQKERILWQTQALPVSETIRSLEYKNKHLYLTGKHTVWKTHNGTWQALYKYAQPPQTFFHRLHAGWVGDSNIQWMWKVFGYLWLALIITGCWVFVRMLLKPKKPGKSRQ